MRYMSASCVFLVFGGIPFVNRDENNIKMITTILFLAIIICCWLFFKSIDWFEKI